MHDISYIIPIDKEVLNFYFCEDRDMKYSSERQGFDHTGYRPLVPNLFSVNNEEM